MGKFLTLIFDYITIILFYHESKLFESNHGYLGIPIKNNLINLKKSLQRKFYDKSKNIKIFIKNQTIFLLRKACFTFQKVDLYTHLCKGEHGRGLFMSR